MQIGENVKNIDNVISESRKSIEKKKLNHRKLGYATTVI